MGGLDVVALDAVGTAFVGDLGVGHSRLGTSVSLDPARELVGFCPFGVRYVVVVVVDGGGSVGDSRVVGVAASVDCDGGETSQGEAGMGCGVVDVVVVAKKTMHELFRAVVAAILFFVLSLPSVYRVTNRLFSNERTDCPTLYTRPIHTLVYFLILMGTMQWSQPNTPWVHFVKVSALGAGIFFLMISPDMYQLTGSGSRKNAYCPTVDAIGIHAGLFGVVNYWLMQLHG